MKIDTQESSPSGKIRRWVIQSDELFKGCREIQIIHGSQEYRLIITKSNKLLLIK